jgi:hypothetical protein
LILVRRAQVTKWMFPTPDIFLLWRWWSNECYWHLTYSCWINYLDFGEEVAFDLVNVSTTRLFLKDQLSLLWWGELVNVPDSSPILAGSIILILVIRALVICRMSWISLWPRFL